jgi:prophage antirepressor-like protein
MQRLQCLNVPGVLRLIQSIPSPKAEPFKRWLAKVSPAAQLLKALALLQTNKREAGV